MSILIKGMEMPKSCVDCSMFDWDLEYLKCKANDKYFKANGEWRKGIEPTCPLIEVPEDVQPVVRCKDCKYCRIEDEYEAWCYDGMPAQLTRANDDFCSHGKRREEGDT